MKTFVVIGLGRFGTAVATELSLLGHEVLAMDMEKDNVQKVADLVTHAAIADARDVAVLKSLGVGNYDCAIVAMGSDVGNSALITLNLKELGIKQVVCKARSHVHSRVLEKIGCDRVVFPEHEMGTKLAQGLSSSNVLNFMEWSDGYSIVELAAPASWRGKSILELGVRNKYHVNIIAIRRGGSEEMNMAPGADWTIQAEDNIVVLGRNGDINALHEVS